MVPYGCIDMVLVLHVSEQCRKSAQWNFVVRDGWRERFRVVGHNESMVDIRRNESFSFNITSQSIIRDKKARGIQDVSKFAWIT